VAVFPTDHVMPMLRRAENVEDLAQARRLTYPAAAHLDNVAPLHHLLSDRRHDASLDCWLLQNPARTRASHRL
jgi:hypothetical protein